MRFSADGRPRFETREELSCYDPLGLPIWVFDVDRHGVWWANRAALELWGAASLAELQARDFSTDSPGVRERLQTVLRHGDWLHPVEEGWTLYPLGKPVTVNARVRPIRIEGERNAILVEASQHMEMADNPEGLRILEAARISPLMISSFSAAGELVTQNPAAAACYGPAEARSGALLHLRSRFASGDIAARLLSAFGSPDRIETEGEVATRVGPRWHRIIATMGRDPLSGQPVLVVAEDDISEHRAAEHAAAAEQAEATRRTSEAAQLSMRRLLAAIEAIPDGFALFDAEDRLVLCNARYREVYPRHADGLQLGQRFEEMLRRGVERGEFADAIGREEEWIAERVERHRDPQGPHEQKLSDGRWLRVEERQTEDGEIVGLRTDITALKALEEQLRRSEERFRDFASAGSDWLWEMDADLRFTYMSANVERMVGVPAEWHYGKTREELLGPDYDRRAWAEHLADLRAHRPFRNFEFERVGEGIETRWLRTSGIPIFNEKGRFAGYRGTGSDITAQKRAEDQLRKREAELARAQKMEAVGQLTGGVAHDFNNLLAVIQGNAELLVELYGENPIEIDAILRATIRGSELTQRLLAFSRQQTLRPKVIDFGELVEGMRKLLSRTLGETIEVATEVDPDLWNAFADRGQVENVLLNLALNARDAMPRGGRLGIECTNIRFAEPHITEDSEILSGDYVMLAVSDNGTGMSPEVKSHAFEPFFTTKEVGQGSGLGLSMVYGFAKQSKGHVTISSEEGNGTVVRLYLPRVQRAAEPEQAIPETRVPRGEGELVLLIEDNHELRSLTRKMLEELGYQVIDVADAAAAERTLTKIEGIDLVLADVVLPGGTSGAEFVEKARRTHPNIGYVLMSGHLAGIADHTAFTRKHKAFLRKPFRRAQLAETLRETLERVGAR